ncbi:MAG TPA: hypothetical protein VKB80_06100 [Kofleriaceae bacterium]|nr:hypothetical protein [Kofleriaceae bacterium]
MAYLYGDSTESPLETNYLEFLRDALDFSVEILVSDYRVQALQESCDEHKRSAEAELQHLRVLSEKVNQLMAEPFGAPQSPAQRCAAQIRQGAEDAIMRMAGQIKQGLSDQLAQVASQVQRERSSPLRSIEILLRHRGLPDSASHVEVTMSPGRGSYVAQSRGRADIGLEWLQTLDIPTSSLFGQLLKVERLSPNLEVRLPEKGGGWRRKGVRVRAHRIGGKFITEVVHAPHQATVKLRAMPEEDEAGYNVLVSASEPRVRLVQVQKGGEHSPPFEPMEEDFPRFLELVRALTEAADDLSMNRGSLREARIDGKSLAEFESPAILVKRLVAKMAPVVTEIARHSLTPDELVLKRVVTDDRREEVFVAKADLIAKLDPVPIALRGVFAPLGLGDLGKPGQAAAGPGGRGFVGADGRGAPRSERMDTNDPITETKDIRPGARASEVPPVSSLPGLSPPAPGSPLRPGESRPPAPSGPVAASRSGPVHPTVRGMNPLQRPDGPRNPNGYPPGSSSPPSAGKRGPGAVPGADDDDVTMVAEARDKTRPPAGKSGSSDDSIDVALSELEHDNN